MGSTSVLLLQQHMSCQDADSAAKWVAYQTVVEHGAKLYPHG
jgi:hypothetical protein